MADLTNWTSPRHFLPDLTTSCLQVLRLDGNQLWDYPVWSLTSLPRLARLSVGENSWPCDCLTVRNIQQLSLLNILTEDNVACTSLSGNSSPAHADNGEGKLSSIPHLRRGREGKNSDIFHTLSEGVSEVYN